LEGYHALVTGGGSGLGLACARWLLRDGATVTIVGRNAQRLEWAEAELEPHAVPGAEGRHAVCDVTDDGWLAPIAAIPVEAWRHVMEVNLTGNFLTLKHTAPAMRAAGGGAYTVISSVAGVLPMAFASPYTAAKAGVDMFVRTAADELGPWGIRVNSV